MRISDWSSDVCSSDLDFKAALPGWWFSVCECQVSCDASCAPTRESPDIALIEHDERFDLGFDADLPQPSTLAQALRSVMADAIEAKAALKDQGRLRDPDTGTGAPVRHLIGAPVMSQCHAQGAQPCTGEYRE